MDATIVIQTGKPPGGVLFKQLIALVNCGLMCVITTDLTKQEIAKKHMQNDYDMVGVVRRPHFRALLSTVLGIDIPAVTHQQVQDILLEQREKDVNAMFSELSAETLFVDTVKPSAIFADYIMGRGLFGSNVKKNQFGDAFIFGALVQNVSAQNPLIIVSDDGDFHKVAKATDHISLFTSVAELFEFFGLNIDNLTSIEGFLKAKHDQLKTLVEEELIAWRLEGLEVEDADIEITNVVSLETKNIVGFRQLDQQGPALIMGTADAAVEVWFQHPDWDGAIYDREDDRLYTFDDVVGETTIDMTLHFAMELGMNDDGEPTVIGPVNILNKGFMYVDLYDDEYPYK